MVAPKGAVLLGSCRVQCLMLDPQHFDVNFFLFCYFYSFVYFFSWGLLKEPLSCLLVAESSLLCTGGLLLSLLATDLKGNDDSVKERKHTIIY